MFSVPRLAQEFKNLVADFGVHQNDYISIGQIGRNSQNKAFVLFIAIFFSI